MTLMNPVSRKQIRLGGRGQNREAKPRLNLITFTTTQLKWDILKQAKLLRNIERWANFFIYSGLTRAEREREREREGRGKILRAEL